MKIVIISGALHLFFPSGCIPANLVKNSNHFFCGDIACNDDLALLFVHVIRLNICKAMSQKLFKETK